MALLQSDPSLSERKDSQQMNLKMKAWRLDSETLNFLGTNNCEDDDDEDEDDVSKRRKTFLDKTMKREVDPPVNKSEEYQEFAKKHYGNVKRLIEADSEAEYKMGTLLHALIPRLGNTTWWKLWTKFILDVAKALNQNILTARSKASDITCFHTAIQEDEVDWLEFVCNIEDDIILRTAIGMTNSREQNCVHLAIAKIDPVKESSFRLVDNLIKKADPETLKKQREKSGKEDEGIGNTCLHDFVDIKLCKALERRCNKAECRCTRIDLQVVSHNYAIQYLRILGDIAEKCPEIINMMNEAKQSPFLFHIHTRSQHESTKTWGRLELLREDESSATIVTDLAANKKQKPKAKDAKAGHALAGKERPPTVPTESARRTGGHHKPVLSKELAADVSRKLLEFSLSQKSFSNICDSLFGQKFPSSELIFKAAPLTDRTTETHRALPLDPILACVELGLVDAASSMVDSGQVVLKSSSCKEGHIARESRERLVKRFFTWLRDTRGVKRIIKLVVSDDPYLPCRDNVISDALQGFDIRHLDWDKQDLCLQSLGKDGVAPNLHELWLSWSGRNSALLGWANEQHGLGTLQKLSTVYVSTNTHWEARSTNDKNLSQFRSSLASGRNGRSIMVQDADDGGSKLNMDGQLELQGALKQGDNWMQAIGVFRHALINFVNNHDRVRPEKLKGQVTVAIIDDGVDLEDLPTAEYIAGGWHPDRKAPDRRSMNAWYLSEKKHGTEMAKLVQFICPYVSLYMAKLDTRRLVYRSVAESAAKAIEEAVNKGANIISMSWTMYKSDNNQDGIQKLMKAIRDAGEERKSVDGETYDALMFCASEDSGFTSHRQPYPATESDQNIIKRVGSAGIYGERSDYVDPGAIDYLFPGEIVSERKLCSGSSASTALAAGLSALILWCAAWQRAELSPPDNKSEANTQPTKSPLQVPNFQTHKRMYGLFDSLKSSEVNPLVNITDILFKAAKNGNPPAKLVELCKEKVGGKNLFE